MKTTSAIILAVSAVASADVTYNATTGEYICSRPNAQWCAGGSFESDIIIRCNAQGRGQPGRCTNNLAGQPPIGVNPSLCWQSTADAGDAACEKNCVVYADTPFRLPGSVCTPYSSVSGTQSLPVGRPTGPVPQTGSGSVSRSAARPTSTGGVGSGPGRGNGTAIRVSSTPGVAPPPRPMSIIGTGGGGGGRGNGTTPSTTRGGGGGVAPGNPTTAPGQSGSPGFPGQPGQPGSSIPSGTRTPVPPSNTPTGPSTVPTAAAAQNTVGYLAVVGVFAAYFL
ncbi:hypothetical protein CkaCkLH20_00047 [Colletotrichum karsti]|uniref:Accumulation-associated protein n=1 Tax=Colletotrichum karsti TaxID=1095194 RepID=A0A9P6IH20_9PEZI|nr:uncharacterized protein CkaCkLH20_00047 [Colletotrichum karsti]KAF9882011.1 hypothetical protein CkaCkLH20_00047 [Colletotrichum karsti]